MKPKILLTRSISKEGIEKLKKEGFEVVIVSKKESPSKKEILKKVKGVSAILSFLTEKIDKEVIDRAGEKLRIISNLAAGFDNINVNYAKEKGIVVTNTPGVLTDAVAEFTVGLILTLIRKILLADKFTREGKFKGWDPNLFLGRKLKGKKVGIVGCGRIGRRVAEILYFGFQCQILYYDVCRNSKLEKELKAKFLPLKSLLKNSDIVSLHVPLLPQTYHLISKKELLLMKPDSFLINTARGPVVNEKDLIWALKNKKIRGAALDVFEFEPKISKELLKLDNVVLTPHIASATVEDRKQMESLAVENIILVLKGKKPKTPV